MSIKSPLRIPATKLGKAADQTAVHAFYAGNSKAFWYFGEGAQPDGRLGFAWETSAYVIWYANETDGTIRCFRNPATQYEPARWSTIEEFQKLPKTKPKKGNFLTQWYYDLLASIEDGHKDSERFLEVPWDPAWRTPTGTTDHGTLIDDDRTGISGYELLGLRPVNGFDISQINYKAGKDVCKYGDWIVDKAAYRTADNVGKYQSRGAGDIPKRAGILTVEDMINGWDEAKSIAIPNVQFGVGATFVAPATRVEHPQSKQRFTGDKYPYGNHAMMIPHGTGFALDMNTRKMNDHLDRYGYTGDLRKAQMNNLIGLTEYGLKVLETSGWDPIVECEGAVNPEKEDKFNSIGYNARIAKIAFSGLFTPGNFYVVNPTDYI